MNSELLNLWSNCWKHFQRNRGWLPEIILAWISEGIYGGIAEETQWKLHQRHSWWNSRRALLRKLPRTSWSNPWKMFWNNLQWEFVKGFLMEFLVIYLKESIEQFWKNTMKVFIRKLINFQGNLLKNIRDNSKGTIKFSEGIPRRISVVFLQEISEDISG